MPRNKLKELRLKPKAINIPDFLLVYKMCHTLPFPGPSYRLLSLPGMSFSSMLSVTGSLSSISFHFNKYLFWVWPFPGHLLRFLHFLQQNISFIAPCIVELLIYVLACLFISFLPDYMISSKRARAWSILLLILYPDPSMMSTL